VTHEAIHKVGGIGAVLEGLLTSEPYRRADVRTILIGPLFPSASHGDDRLGETGEVLYSSLDNIARHPQLAETFGHIRREYQVDIVYGYRSFINPHNGVSVRAEVVLVDVSRISLDRLNCFKAGLWDAYGINSRRYEHSWEYDLYVKLALPAIEVLRALGAAGRPGQCVIVAHEFMGLPTALATRFDPTDAFRTIFYAHETATVRPIVEHHAGHDVTFYNVLHQALARGRYLDDVFGSQDHYYRHALVKAAADCDRILAVGDDVERELRFLGPCMQTAAIDVSYNGIPAESITLEQRKESRSRLAEYAEALLGDRPEYVFTHVTRNVTSKGLWRDFRVLEQLEPMFRKQGKSAVMFVLSTELPARSPEDVVRMEADWDWPIAHREGQSDLSYGEAIFYAGVQQFNARSRQIKIVFVNQFGWSPELCGRRMPEDMTLLDIRRGTDVEFGQSIYEPFGISQLEPLTYGAVCVPSTVCGCAGLVHRITGGRPQPNVIVADYCGYNSQSFTEGQWMTLTRKERHEHEVRVAAGVAKSLMSVLPTSDTQMEAMLERGYELASKMSWDVIARSFVMPAIDELSPPVLPQIRVA
jgi:glycosyltransferase involved in cell wall biosynthesis